MKRILKVATLIAVVAVMCGCPKIAKAQVPVTISPVPRQQFFSASGVPLANGCIATYLSGTSTPAATYTDQTGNFVASNPIILDGGGFASIWLAAQAYRFVLFSAGGVNCATGAQQWLIDGINPAPFLGGANAWTGAQSFAGTSTFNGAVNINAGGTLTGSFSGSPAFSGTPNFLGTPTFNNLQPFPAGITTDAITGTLTNGGTFQLALAQGTGTNNGENFNMQAGNGPTGNIGAGGFAFIGAGNGGSNGGNGGLASLTAGTAVSSNGAGGNATINGGNAVGTATGGSTIITAGQGGLTAGAGGNAKLIGGAGGTGGIGGDVQLTPGAGSGAANGSVIVQYGRLISSGATVQPTCASTGIGASGTCATSGDSGDSWGLVTLTVAGAGPTATGTVTLTFNHTMGGGGAACTWSINSAGSGTWNGRATAFSGAPAGLNTTVAWDNNSVALNAGSSYDLTYFCGGRQ